MAGLRVLTLAFWLAFPVAAAAQGLPSGVDPRDWRVSFIPGVTDPDGNLLNVTEVRQFAAFNGKLYAAAGAWMDQGPDKGSAKVLRLDSANGQWRQEADFGDGTTGGLVALNWKQSESGAPVNVTTLVASIWSGATVFTKNNSDGQWYRTDLDPAGQIRAFATWKDEDANKTWGFAGGKPGIFRGQLSDKRGAGKTIIKWETGAANVELNTAALNLPLCSGGGRVTGFAAARGRLFASACWNVYVRQDGDQGGCAPSEVADHGNACEPRWRLFWSDPLAAQGESGIRGLTTVSIGGEQFLLAGAESAAAHITRIDPESAAAVIEFDVSNWLDNALGPTGYTIIPYNAPAPLWYGPDGVGRRIFGFEAWMPGEPSPGMARKLVNIDDGPPQVMLGEGMFFVRNAPSSFELHHIPAITPQPMTAVRDAIASPFPEECNAKGQDCVVYFGGFDANKSVTQTPCLASPCTFPPLVEVPTHDTGWIVKGKLD